MAEPLHRSLLPQVLDDLRALNDIDPDLVDAALQAVTDLAQHRKTGKVLRARHVPGDLTTTRRLKFDLDVSDRSDSVSSTACDQTMTRLTPWR